ncbi:hypothetical protein DFAR_3190007 [Desulfarculales bacterium]
MTQGALPVPGRSPRRSWDTLCLGLNATDYLCLIPKRSAGGSKQRIRRMASMGGGQAATAAPAVWHAWATAWPMPGSAATTSPIKGRRPG